MILMSISKGSFHLYCKIIENQYILTYKANNRYLNKQYLIILLTKNNTNNNNNLEIEIRNRWNVRSRFCYSTQKWL